MPIKRTEEDEFHLNRLIERASKLKPRTFQVDIEWHEQTQQFVCELYRHGRLVMFCTAKTKERAVAAAEERAVGLIG